MNGLCVLDNLLKPTKKSAEIIIIIPYRIFYNNATSDQFYKILKFNLLTKYYLFKKKCFVKFANRDSHVLCVTSLRVTTFV